MYTGPTRQSDGDGHEQHHIPEVPRRRVQCGGQVDAAFRSRTRRRSNDTSPHRSTANAAAREVEEPDQRAEPRRVVAERHPTARRARQTPARRPIRCEAAPAGGTAGRSRTARSGSRTALAPARRRRCCADRRAARCRPESWRSRSRPLQRLTPLSIRTQATPSATPNSTSRPTTGSRTRPVRTLVHDTRTCGQCRRTNGSSAR